MEATIWKRWVRCPQSLRIRQVLFWIHSCVGIGVGLYVFLISVSGTALIFYPELYAAFSPRSDILPGSDRSDRLDLPTLKRAAERAHPGFEVNWIWDRKGSSELIEIWMSDGVKQQQCLFDPFTGRDLGEAIPKTIQFLNWVKKLHANLALGRTGQLINGLGAVLLVVLGITGAVIWWPGRRSWKRHLTVRPRVCFKRLNRELHSAIGFWTVPLVLTWGLTGIVLVLAKNPVRHFDVVMAIPTDLAGMCYTLHVGRFASTPIKPLWGFIGLIPSILFITGVIMWWKRSATNRQVRFR